MTIGRLFTNNRIDFTCRANFPSFNTSIKKNRGVSTPLRTTDLPPRSSLVGVESKREREREKLRFILSDRWETAWEFVYLFPIKKMSEAGSSFAEPSLPCHQRFISTSSNPPPSPLSLDERKSLINFEPRH